jgi:hypothetical protein
MTGHLKMLYYFLLTAPKIPSSHEAIFLSETAFFRYITPLVGVGMMHVSFHPLESTCAKQQESTKLNLVKMKKGDAGEHTTYFTCDLFSTKK